MSKLSRIVYHVDMNSHPVSIHGMKTVYTAVADPGEGHGRPPPSHLRVWMNAPPPLPLSEGPCPPLLCAREWHRNLSDMWRSTFKINATQLRSVTEPAPKSLCEEKPYEASSDMVFVPVQKLSRIVYRCCGSVLSLV